MEVTDIRVNTGNLQKDIGKLREALNGLIRTKDTMVGEVQELNTMWKGPANLAFNQQFMLDQEEFENLSGILEKMLQAMENAREQYDICDSKVNDLVNTIRI